MLGFDEPPVMDSGMMKIDFKKKLVKHIQQVEEYGRIEAVGEYKWAGENKLSSNSSVRLLA